MNTFNPGNPLSSPAYLPANTQSNSAVSFSELVQRIVQSNSGKQRAVKSSGNANLDGRQWEECRVLAEEALSNHNYARAEAMWLRAVARAESLPLRDWRRVYGLESLLSLYYSQRRLHEAEVFCDRYNYQVQAVYGVDHFKCGDAFNFMASIYFGLERYEQATEFASKAYSIYKHGEFPDQAKLAMACYNLAVINHAIGDFVSADDYYKQAYSIRRELFGEEAEATQNVVCAYNEMLADHESHVAARKIINQLLG